MASLDLVTPAAAGTADALTAVTAGGDSFPIPRPIMLRLKNTDVAARTVTLVGQKPCNQGFTHSATINVPAGGGIVNARITDTERFRDANGRIQLTYDAATGLSVAAFVTA
jgi:hypothetical protein